MQRYLNPVGLVYVTLWLWTLAVRVSGRKWSDRYAYFWKREGEILVEYWFDDEGNDTFVINMILFLLTPFYEAILIVRDVWNFLRRKHSPQPPVTESEASNMTMISDEDLG